jgi:SAM-dependent methyltransferase
MSGIVGWLDRRLYPRHADNWDDEMFRERILRHLNAGSIVLDLGAGAGIVSQMNFKGLAARICGVDLDQRVTSNQMLDEGRVADAGGIPYPDDTFDVVFADNVVEHLSEPAQVFLEVRRVLKPGGVFLFNTPNKTHYMPLIARMTPHKFHQFVNRLRGRAEVDTFPTRYRSNTIADATAVAKAVSLSVDRLERIEGRPEYLRMAWPLYLVGATYERIVNSSEMLAPFRILLIAQLRKLATEGSTSTLEASLRR